MTSKYDNANEMRKDLENQPENFWSKRGERMAFRLFKQASARVPAYHDFLKKKKVNPDKIKTISDFSKVPFVDKKNYLSAYPIEKLCWDGNIGSMDTISLSSGSSGVPFFWLRGKEQEQETALSHELFLLDSFKVDKKSTLFIVSFAMGMWVAGTLTHRAVEDISSRYNMTVIAPGINKNDVLNIVKKIGNKYDQIIVAGYPPFVKDIIDEGETQEINWGKYQVKFLFAAEAFSEGWRDYLYKKVSSKNPLEDSLNIYGTADALILGHETPLSILIRRKAMIKSDIYKTLFSSEERIPTLVQYNPALRYFEQIGKNLIFTTSSGIPLVRYNIGDEGGLIKFSSMNKIFSSFNIDLNKEAQNQKISTWHLPFLYVFGRDDSTATLYGINIYPETIREAINSGGIQDHVSGKFTILTKSNNNFNQYLEVNVELKNKTENYPPDLKNKIKETVTNMLKLKNNEYNELYKSLNKKAEPEIKLCSYGDKKFFVSGVKQKWTKREV